MATLWITEPDFEASSGCCTTSPSLRDWLAGDWGLVFSHPADFDDSGLEADRWLAILRDEFLQRGVRPLACTRAAVGRDASWVGKLIGDDRVVRLGGAQSGEDVVDLSLRALRDDILGIGERFALIIDDTLRRRGVLKYSAARATVSPLDLLSSIDALRRRSALRRAA